MVVFCPFHKTRNLVEQIKNVIHDDKASIFCTSISNFCCKSLSLASQISPFPFSVHKVALILIRRISGACIYCLLIVPGLN